MKLYMDTSALVKLVVAEPESSALLAYLRKHDADDLITSDLARTELVRAVAPNGAPAIAKARNILRGIDTVALSRQMLDDAGTLAPPQLRSLDAIHLVAARKAGDLLRAVVTYDVRMVEAAAALGMDVQTPR